MTTIVKDSSGKEWAILSSSHRSYTSGCVSRWIVRCEFIDADGQPQRMHSLDPDGRIAQAYHAAAEHARTDQRPAPILRLQRW